MDRGLGVDNRRGRWRPLAALDERTVAADKWLVRAAFGPFGLSGNWLVPRKIRGRRGLRLCSVGRCCFLFRRRENCFGGRKLIDAYFQERFQTRPICRSHLSAPSACTIMKLLQPDRTVAVARQRKVRTPQSSVPDNVREGTRAFMGGTVRRKVPQKIYRPGRKARVRVKRCGKSAPPPQ